MSYIYNMTDTWDNAGVTWTAIKMNVTNTASDAASNVMDLQVGGTSLFVLAKGGNVGIGTTSPTQKLHVVGNIYAGTATYYQTLNGSGLTVVTPSGASPTLRLLQSGISDWSIYNVATTGTLSLGGYLYVSTGGNVGIGTSSPSFPLDVQSTGVGSTIAARIFRSDGTVALLRIGNSTSGSGSSAPAYGSDTTAAVVYTNNTERMRIDNSGNVGIGTSSPVDKLQVEGNLYFGTSNRVVYTGGAGNLTLQTSTGVLAFNTGGSVERMRITSAGNLQLGTASLATTATDGFPYIPTCAGTPTGTPTAITGYAPMVVDSTNNKLYVYVGGAWVAMN